MPLAATAEKLLTTAKKLKRLGADEASVPVAGTEPMGRAPRPIGANPWPN